MNANTNKTQTSPDLIDQAEAIGTTLEQAECALNLLFNEYQSSPHLPVFMVIDDLIVKAKQQNSELLGDLPKKHVPPAFPILNGALENIVTGDIRTEALELVAIAKIIFSWLMKQEAIAAASCELDSGDIANLSDLVRSKAQRIVDLTNVFEDGVCPVEAQA
ncbi:MAG: hypothetical protein E6Q85_07210 [Thiothrix sp.]|nr:MAG: hypothetical protein E6Q85_07210 [Thiothrix sp.]